MKKLILLLAIVATFSSCKKDYITNVYVTDKGSIEQVEVHISETTNVTDDQIKSNNWTHVGEFGSRELNLFIWKYKSGNMVVIIENVPGDIFWSPKFAIGTTLTGKELLALKNATTKEIPVYIK